MSVESAAPILRRVAITGGTGSFGNAVVTHLLSKGVERIDIVSRDEAKQDEMRRRYADSRLHFWIGDVRDIRSLRRPLQHADALFHAAALKQVPSCELFPEQAVMTNILGSQNVLECAAELGIQRVVCLSTDKAVQPLNAMGMTKALMEKQIHAVARRLGEHETTVCCVRYGNVLYSRGSVIPLFVENILQGKSLPVTHYDMTRFLLPLSQAVELVETALQHGRQGDFFIRKSPAATIRVLVDAFSSILGRNVPAHTIGIRSGEKMHETLATAEEMTCAHDLGNYWRIPLTTNGVQPSPTSTDNVHQSAQLESFTSDNTKQLNVSETVELLRELPEFQPFLTRLQYLK